MPLVIADRVRETTTSTGTGTITLAGAAPGFQSFAAIGNGNTTYYAIIESSTGAWEVGIGTYTSAGTTLSRTTILSSSNGGAAVNLIAGTKDVICTQPASRAVYDNEAGTGIVFPGGSVQPAAAKTFVTRRLTSGTTYTTPSGVSALWVFASGAIGGQSGSGSTRGGRGGPGYSEIYIASPAASYSYTIGAAGANTGTAGGTTTWGSTISITGSGGVTSGTGSAGGVASGGDFNANGGSGGTTSNSTYPGGGGGAGSRAGAGGAGGGYTSSSNNGGGGGSGGNNASSGTPGIAATTKAAGASALADLLIFQETFNAGSISSSSGGCPTTYFGGSGAPNNFTFNGAAPGFGSTSASAVTQVTLSGALNNGGVGQSTPVTGSPGVIVVVEVYNQ